MCKIQFGKLHDKKVVLIVSTFLLALCLSGCASELAGVSGEVTYDGKAIDDGQIKFIPLSKEKEFYKTGEVIVEGHYKLRQAAGLKPGRYRVEIYWPQPIGPAASPYEEPPSRERLPARFNTNSTLEIELHGGRNVEDFHLEK